MAAQLVSRARLAGATRVAAASSGNAGVSLAAYCAAAGLQAEIAITRNCPALQREAMQRSAPASPRSKTAWAAGRTWPNCAANKAPSPAPTT